MNALRTFKMLKWCWLRAPIETKNCHRINGLQCCKAYQYTFWYTLLPALNDAALSAACSPISPQPLPCAPAYRSKNWFGRTVERSPLPRARIDLEWRRIINHERLQFQTISGCGAINDRDHQKFRSNQFAAVIK